MMNQHNASLKFGSKRLLPLPLLLALLLAGCATRTAREASAPVPAAPQAATKDTGTAMAAASEKPPELSKLYKGSGVLVQGQEEGGDVPPSKRLPAATPGPTVTLNFEGADI